MTDIRYIFSSSRLPSPGLLQEDRVPRNPSVESAISSKYIGKDISDANNFLLISYHFPPSTAVGGVRIANFAKYFYIYGWKTLVLTIKDRYVAKTDEERMKGVAGIKIFKTSQFYTLSDLYNYFKRVYLKNKPDRPPVKEFDAPGVRPNAHNNEHETVWKRCKRYFLSFLELPDGERRWFFPAVAKGILVIRRENIRCILTSCPPQSVHLIGLALKMITGVKWVVDYRDPWVIGRSKKRYPTSALSLAIEGWLERMVVRHADLVIFTTESLCNNFKESFPFQYGEKFLSVSNGFDSEFFEKYSHLAKYDRFTVTYAGSIYFDRTPEPVFKALQELYSGKIIELSDINVKLIGDCDYANGIPMSEIVKQYGLESAVEILGTVPYSEAMEIITQSHLALLIAYDQPLQIPAKVFDYMGSGTKILALCKEGATSDLVRRTQTGSVFDPDDVEGIKAFLVQSIMTRNSLDSDKKSGNLEKYERKKIIHDLASRLEKLCDVS